jgi:hypothetical protein
VEGILKAGLKLSTSYHSYRYILANFEPESFPLHAIRIELKFTRLIFRTLR